MSHRAHAWSKFQKTGGPARKGLLLVLADMCSEDNTCFPSIGLLAEIMEATDRYVRELLRDLAGLGLIEINHRYRDGRRTSSLYRLLVPEGFDEGSAKASYRNHSSVTTGTMVPKLEEPEFLAEPPVEPPLESPDVSAVAETSSADAVASSASHAVACSREIAESAARIPAQRQAAAAKREAADPRAERVPYYGTSEDPSDGTKRLYDAIDAMADAACMTQWAEFRRMRPSISKGCLDKAENQLAKADGESSERVVVALALKYGVRHYEGHWPRFVVPESMRPKSEKEDHDRVAA